MNKNMKPLYLNTENGKIVFSDEQPSAGAVVAHIEPTGNPDEYTCDLNALQISILINEGTPVFLQAPEGDVILTAASCVSYGNQDLDKVRVQYRCVFFERIIGITIFSDGSAELDEKKLGYEVRVYFDGDADDWAYECDCDLGFSGLRDQIGHAPVSMLLSAAGLSCSSSMAYTDGSDIYFRIWNSKSGWGSIVIGEDSVSVDWDSDN